MKNIFSKDKALAIAIFVLAFAGLVTGARYVTNFGKVQLDQNELLSSDGTTRLTLGDQNTINGSLAHGDNKTGTSVTMPTVATGVNFASWVPVKNVGTTAIVKGDVLIASVTTLGTLGGVRSHPGTLNLTTVVGCAAEAIAAQAVGWMVPRGGGYALVKTTGTVAIGEILVSSNTSVGSAGVDATPTTGADFATAMEAGTAAGDVILAILH